MPEPVAPVIRIIPFGLAARSLITLGIPRVERLGIALGMRRSTMAGPCTVSSRLILTLTKEKECDPSNSFCRLKLSTWPGLSTSRSQSRNVSALVTGQGVATMSPRLRKRGTSPTPRWISE